MLFRSGGRSSLSQQLQGSFMRRTIFLVAAGVVAVAGGLLAQQPANKIKDASDFAYVQPGTALAEINATAWDTAANSLMPESGAPSEWHAEGSSGSALDAAFGPLMRNDLPTLTGSTPTGDYIPQRN